VALGGLLRDVAGSLAARGAFGESLAGPATGYAFVYSVELVLLLATIAVMSTLVRDVPRLPAARNVPMGAE
jgi:BCD family chlorophyll transporter-like MFS transporter